MADKVVRIGLVGLEYWGPNYLRTLRDYEELLSRNLRHLTVRRASSSWQKIVGLS